MPFLSAWNKYKTALYEKQCTSYTNTDLQDNNFWTRVNRIFCHWYLLKWNNQTTVTAEAKNLK